jgi:aromatic ring hydroxylase
MLFWQKTKPATRIKTANATPNSMRLEKLGERLEFRRRSRRGMNSLLQERFRKGSADSQRLRSIRRTNWQGTAGAIDRAGRGLPRFIGGLRQV